MARLKTSAHMRAARLQVLGWRDVPRDVSAVGEIATKTMPRMKQIFIQSQQVRWARSARCARDGWS